MITVRPFVANDEEYATIVAIYNAVWPDEPVSITERKHGDEQWPSQYLHARYIIESDTGVIGEGIIEEPYWHKTQDKYFFGYSLYPPFEGQTFGTETAHDAVYAYVRGFLDARKPVALLTGTREDIPPRLDWLAANGFRRTMRSWDSELDLTTFDFSRFAGTDERITEMGIEILTLPQLQEQDPNWGEKIYDLWMDLEMDVPSSDPPERIPRAEFDKIYTNPSFCPEGWFIAVDGNNSEPGGTYAGISTLGTSEAKPDKMYTWLTGVRRQYRRKGLATAMKLRAVAFARSRKATTIWTGNEENNPMLGINLLLGFKEKVGWLDFEKTL